MNIDDGAKFIVIIVHSTNLESKRLLWWSIVGWGISTIKKRQKEIMDSSFFFDIPLNQLCGWQLFSLPSSSSLSVPSLFLLFPFNIFFSPSFMQIIVDYWISVLFIPISDQSGFLCKRFLSSSITFVVYDNNSDNVANSAQLSNYCFLSINFVISCRISFLILWPP